MAELEYEYKNGHYFAEVVSHSWQCPIDEEAEILMAQYSENTCRQNGCYRYGELGCVYSGSSTRIGLSGQYTQFLVVRSVQWN